ncbi:glycosyltransferase family 25 protein, partial [Melanomma pulvis-pyrius CBS 109.77]
MPLLTVQGNRITQVLIVSIVVLAFFTFNHFGSSNLSSDSAASSINNVNNDDNKKSPSGFKAPAFNFGSKTPPEKPKPANATLDFQEIIYLSMPYRTDRQDALSLVAAAAGLKLTMMPGKTPDSIHPKAMPPHIGPHNMTGKAWLGVWRAHADVWRYIIDNNVQSALIIEDDVDFDVGIKEIMGNFNWQLRFNNTIRWGKNVEKGWEEECPYGCDWDDIFLGQCGGSPNLKRLDLHAVVPDPHSPNVSSIHPWWKKEFQEVWNLTESAGVRVIAPTYDPICLMSYGVTRMGAMRLLYHIGGWRPFGNPVDNEVAWKAAEGKTSGYTMSPPAFVAWRVGGAQDSDNNAAIGAKPMSSLGNMGGSSVGVKNSIRKSLEGFFKKNYWEDMKDEL